MAKLIKAKTVTEAWLTASEFLIDEPKRDCVHLYLDIQDPTVVNTNDVKVCSIVSDFLVKNEAQPLDTVAETIFPRSHYLTEGRNGVFTKYPLAMEEIFEGLPGDKKWGNYALRMLRQNTLKGETYNQLEAVLKKLKCDNKKSCFEVSPGRLFGGWAEPENIAEIPIYDPALDHTRPLGGPCLSHLSFTRDAVGESIHLNATYRSHYYVERALGNLIGLSGLLAFVGQESQHPIGTLAINASYAKLDYQKFGGVSAVLELLARCRNVYDTNRQTDSKEE